jgi:hypothetical protein
LLLRPSFLALAITVMLAGCADGVAPPTAPALAAGGADLAKITNETSVSRFDVTFTLPAGSCGLTTTVTGTGVYLSQSRVSQTAAGEWRIGIHESASGTATGEDGSQYRFNYVANYRVLDVVEPFALPMVLDLVDHFNLLGQNGAPDIKVFLKGQFLFTGSLPVTPIGAPVIRGGLECDPL